MPPRRFEDVADKACAYLSSFRTAWQPLVQEMTNNAIKRVFTGVFEQQQQRIRRNRYLSTHEEDVLMSTSSGSTSGDESIDKDDSTSTSSSVSDSDSDNSSDKNSNNSSKKNRCAKRKERSFDNDSDGTGGEGDVSSMDDDDAGSLSTREDKFVNAEESSEANYESFDDEITKDGDEQLRRPRKRRRIAYKEVTDDDVTAVVERNDGEEEDFDDDTGSNTAQFSHGTEVRKVCTVPRTLAHASTFSLILCV